MKKIFLAVPILFSLFQVCFTQDKPKAVLIDELGDVTCEHVLSRLDSFLEELRNNPNAIGHIVLNSRTFDEKSFRFPSYERFIFGHLEFRRFDSARVTYIVTESPKDFRIQFWLVPFEAENPNYEQSKTAFDLSNRRKPFLFYSTRTDGGPCPTENQLESFSNRLKYNPDFRGHIVIFTKTARGFRQKRDYLLKQLADKRQIPENRLKFFWIKEDLDEEFTLVEYWLVPKRK